MTDHDHNTHKPDAGDTGAHLSSFTIPTWLIYLLVTGAVLSWIPLALIARARASHSPKPRVHIFQDMDVQPRFGPQSYAGAESPQLDATLFADKRGMRPPVPGAVAFSDEAARLDDHFYRGYQTGEDMKPKLVKTGEGEDAVSFIDPKSFIDGYPEQITVDEAFIRRGQERFNIYCALCHGEDGYGNGLVNQHVQALIRRDSAAATGWGAPRNLHDASSGVTAYPEGRIFYVISEGWNTMAGYKSQISVEDRWAIVAYVRALQASKRVPVAAAQAMGVSTEGLPEPPPKEEKIVVEDEDELADPELIAQGKALFTAKICATCHQVDPAVPAPAGEALKATKFIGKFWGEKRTVTKGPGGEETEAVFDYDYADESIAEPMKLIVKGSVPGMAPLPTTPEERKAIIAYIKSLSE